MDVSVCTDALCGEDDGQASDRGCDRQGVLHALAFGDMLNE